MRRGAGRAAVVAGPGELPSLLLAGHRMDALLGLAGPQVKSPRLGVQRVADDQRPDTVADLLGPQQLAVAAAERRHAASREFAGEELLPVMAIQVHAEQDQHTVLVHRRRRVAEFRQVHGVLPDDLAVALVQAHHQADLGVGQHGLGPLAFDLGQLGNRRPTFREGLLALFLRHVAGDDEHQVVAHRDGIVKQLLAVQAPALLAAVEIHGKQRVALTRSGRPRAVQCLAVGGHVAPAAEIARRRGRCAVLADRLAGFHVQQQAVIVESDQQALAADGQVAAVVRGVGPIGSRQLAPPQPQAVVDIVGHDDIFALDEQPAVEGQGAGGPHVPVGHVPRPRVAEPQQAQRRLDDLVVAAGGVAQVAVQVRPVAGAGQRPADELGPNAVLLDQLAAGQGRLGEPALRGLDSQRRDARGHPIRLANQDCSAQRLDQPHQLGRVAGPLAGQQRRLGNDQVGEIVRVRQLFQRPLLDAYAAAVQSGGVQSDPRGRDFLCVWRDRVDRQFGAFGQLPGQLARLAAVHQAETSLDPGPLEDRIRRPGEQVAVRRGGERVLSGWLVDHGRGRGRCCRRRGKAVDPALVRADQ